MIEYIDYQNTVYTQTEAAFSSASKIVSSYSETKSEGKQDSSDSGVNLGKFLNKVIPLFENAFEENRKSQAFEGYELIEVRLFDFYPLVDKFT